MIFYCLVVVGLDLLNIACERDSRIEHIGKFLLFYPQEKLYFWFFFAF